MKPTDPLPPLPYRRGSVEYCLGSEADHEAVYQTLLNIFRGPDRSAFLASLNDPTYHPEQRLLTRVDGRIASHLQLTEREMRIGAGRIRINGLLWIGTLPEYRGLGFAHNLIRFAEQRGAAAGAAMQSLTTNAPGFHESLGWVACGRARAGRISTRNLPGSGDGMIESRHGMWHVRPWRQVELGDLMRLYDSEFGATTGSLTRTEDDWRWIISRRQAHVVWVACQGEAVRGYAFVKDHRILEIAHEPDAPQALQSLLGRVRAEALERAYPSVLIHAPPEAPALRLLLESGGRMVDDRDNEAWLFRALNVEAVLRGMIPEFARRAAIAADSSAGTGAGAGALELGLEVEDRRWTIQARRGTCEIVPEKSGRKLLHLTRTGFTRLAMGESDPETILNEEADCSASGPAALEVARRLFPAGSVWRSPLDAGWV